MNLQTETGRAIPGYEGMYSVTKGGEVYSLPRKGNKELKIMKAVDNMPAGYLRVSLTKNGRTKLTYIHRLVALTYIPNPGTKSMVNHIDGKKQNNKVENLEWVTSMENHTHAFELGLYPNRIMHPSKKPEVYELVRQGEPVSKVAEKYGMTAGGIRTLVKRYKAAQGVMAEQQTSASVVVKVRTRVRSVNSSCVPSLRVRQVPLTC